MHLNLSLKRRTVAENTNNDARLDMILLYPRASCCDPVPSCYSICDKILNCSHKCKASCHQGPCPLF